MSSTTPRPTSRIGSLRYDLILDLAGNTPLPRLRRALTPAGTLVIAGGEDAGRWTGMGRQMRAVALSPFVHQRLTSLLSRQRQADLELLAQLIEAGQITPVIGKHLSAAPRPRRHARSASRTRPRKARHHACPYRMSRREPLPAQPNRHPPAPYPSDEESDD